MKLKCKGRPGLLILATFSACTIAKGRLKSRSGLLILLVHTQLQRADQVCSALLHLLKKKVCSAHTFSAYSIAKGRPGLLCAALSSKKRVWSAHTFSAYPIAKGRPGLLYLLKKKDVRSTHLVCTQLQRPGLLCSALSSQKKKKSVWSALLRLIKVHFIDIICQGFASSRDFFPCWI